MRRYILAAFALLGVVIPSSAQSADGNPNAGQYIYWDCLSDYKLGQATTAFTAIDGMLQAYPPEKKIPLPRKLTLASLDQLLHDNDNDATEPFYTYINTRMQRVLKNLDIPVTEGLRIYKLYNDGFIVKSSKATIAIDLIPGGPAAKPFLTDSVVYGIAGKCDALLISHFHSDHANLNVAKAFAESGKLVIAPKNLWVGIHPLIRPMEEEDQEMEIEIDSLDVTLHVLPGHQEDVYNNINVVDFRNAGTVAHTGDQWGNLKDLEMMDTVHVNYDIDVFMPNCWMDSLERAIKGFAPSLIITGHENEMEHTIDHREAYWLTIQKMEKMANLNIPYVLMSWGEWYEYRKEETQKQRTE